MTATVRLGGPLLAVLLLTLGMGPAWAQARGVTLAIADDGGERLELYRGGSYALVIGVSDSPPAGLTW